MKKKLSYMTEDFFCSIGHFIEQGWPVHVNDEVKKSYEEAGNPFVVFKRADKHLGRPWEMTLKKLPMWLIAMYYKKLSEKHLELYFDLEGKIKKIMGEL